MERVINVISRRTNDLIVHSVNDSPNMAVFIPHTSVVQIQGNVADVVRYVRVDNELIIYFQDGTFIKLRNYFSDPDEPSELVFESEGELSHVTFDEPSTVSSFEPVELVASTSTIESIAPFFEGGWGYELGVGAALLGGIGGYLLSNDKSTTHVEAGEKATPSFIVTDDKGDQLGILNAGAITDDNTPTFSGTGQSGATIQIKDASGNTVASTIVNEDGTWSVILSEQADGSHTWSVVQINGDVKTPVGDISITISSDVANISLNSLSQDNVINKSELLAGLVLSGQTSGFAAGSALTVSCNGNTYETVVNSDGFWTLTVPTNDSQLIGDGQFTVTVTGKDTVGNLVSGSQNYQVDTAAPTLTINTIAADDILNIAEQRTALIITGSSNAQVGQSVTVTLNGKSYNGTVGTDGNWSVTVPAADVGALGGKVEVKASVDDVAGNIQDVYRNFTVDSTAPTVIINTIAGDNIINASELEQSQIISGKATGAAEGSKVLVTVGGKQFTTVVDADGNWSIGIASISGLKLTDGKLVVEVNVTNSSGNSGTATTEVKVDTNLSALSIETIAEDSILNAIEQGQALTIYGVSIGLNAGTEVTVSLNNKVYTTTITSDGTWSVDISPADLALLANTNYLISAAAINEIGNRTSVQENLLVDNTQPKVIIDTVAGNDIVNAAEVATGQSITGRVSNAAAGDEIKMTLGGVHYTAIVQDDLTWSIKISSEVLTALGDGDITLSASVTNARGNTGSAEHDFTIDAKLPSLRLNTISGDNVINSLETGADLVISGTSFHLAVGTSINVTINGKVYGATIMAGGVWQTGVNAADVAAWPVGALNIIAEGLSSAGTAVSITHPVTVDLSALAISIDAVTGDNIINAVEKGQTLTLSGRTSNVETGQEVTITLNGQRYFTTVDSEGNWSVDIPSDRISVLKEGDYVVQASVKNISGNNTQASQVIEVDTSAPTLTINAISSDDVINAIEKGSALTIAGKCNAMVGQTVTVILNEKEYLTTVDELGQWTLNVPAAEVGGLADGEYLVSATVADVAGNEALATRELSVHTAIPEVTIDLIAQDNVLNATEAKQALTISGSVTGVTEGVRVVIDFNGKQYATIVDANGNWILGIPSAVISKITDGNYDVKATVVTNAGNTGFDTSVLTVNKVAPTITIGDLASDNVLNAIEKDVDLTVTGTSTGLSAGTAIIVKLNGRLYSAIVGTNGTWALDIPVADVAYLANTGYSITATAENDVGNIADAFAQFVVDTTLPQVIINTVAGDDTINSYEVAAGQTIKGRVINAAAGDTVAITVGSKTYTTTVEEDLSWSIELTGSALVALGDGNHTVSASVTNANGNSGSAERTIIIDAQLPSITINTVAGDNIINIIESQQALVISGTSTQLATGSSINVTVNGKVYGATIMNGGLWQIGIDATEVNTWPAGPLNIVAEGKSSVGVSVDKTASITVNLYPGAISIDTVAEDNVINAAEKGQVLTLSGKTTDVAIGETVSVTLNGKTYNTTVTADGTWTVAVPAIDVGVLTDGSFSVTAAVKDNSLNNVFAAQDIKVDSVGPVIFIGDVSVDNVLNAAEKGEDLVIGGSTNAETDQAVTVTLNGKNYLTKVDEHGQWSLNVPALDLTSLVDGKVTVTVTVADKAGNSSSASHNFFVDATPPVLTINTVAGDNVINAVESTRDGVISGTAVGVSEGKLVKVTFNGQTFVTAVDSAGKWIVGVPSAFMSKLADGTLPIVASVVDTAGNIGSVTHNVEVNTKSGNLEINNIAVDNVLNAVEKGEDLIISGSSTGLSAGTDVIIKLNNTIYSAKVDSAGKWSVIVPPADLAKLGDVSYLVTASATDSSGNGTSTDSSLLVDTQLPTVTINTVAGDDIINNTEVESTVVISGKAANVEIGQIVTILLGGNTYTAVVRSDLTWSVNVPSNELKAMGDGELTIKASVTNQNGNTGSSAHEINIDADLPGLRVNTVSGDDIINSIEAEHALIVTGTSSGIATGSIINVVINGKTYSTNILADGSWNAPVPAAEVATWSEGSLTIRVSGQSTAGNAVSISHPITIDLSDVAISVNPITADNIINAVEKAAGLTLTGETRNVENGQKVTIKLNGKEYTASVKDNAWTCTVSAADAAKLIDGNRYLQVNVTNANGNGASSIHEFDVDSVAPSLKINTIALDDIVNAIEHNQELVVSGTSNTQIGRSVTVTLNNKSYIAEVNSDGVWSLKIPSTDVGSIADGKLTVTARVTDTAGNATSVNKEIIVDTTAPAITINKVTADNIINSTEAKAGVAITGTSDAEVGSKVVVIFNDRTYETAVKADGSWSVNVLSQHLSGVMQGPHDIVVKVTDTAGNTSSSASTVTVDLDPPTLTIDVFAKDSYINIAEHELTQTISGTSNAIGQEVKVTLNGKTYTTTVTNLGTWSLDVPAVAMQALTEGQNTISATVGGAYGNSITTERSFEVDLTAPTAVANVEMITQDTGINTSTGASQANGDFRTSDNKFILSGSTTGSLSANDILQVSYDGGKNWTNVELINGNWSIANTDKLLDGTYTYYFRVVDNAGNVGKIVSKTVTVDTEVPDYKVTISGYEDDVGIYQSDKLGLFTNGSYTDDKSVLLKGTLDKEISAQLGETGVIRIYNGTTLLGVATVNGTSWSFVVKDLAEGAHNLTAVVVDLVGNEGAYSQKFVINVDVSAPSLTATINNYIDNIDTKTNNVPVTLGNNSETNDSLPLLQGSLSGALAVTDTVRVYSGSGVFIGTATVSGTSWSLQTTVPLTEGSNTFKVCVVDQAGNHGTYSSDFNITLDTTPPTQTATINSYIDNFDNGDYQTGVFYTGSHTNDTTPELQGKISAALAVGEVLRIYQNGKYIGDATVNADLTWSYLIKSALSDASYDFTAVVSDAAGNEGQWSSAFNLTVDTIPPSVGAVTVNSLTTADSTPTITGTVSGVSDGYRLQVKVNGVLYTHGIDDELTVTGANWSLRIPAINALNLNGTVDATYNVETRIADLAGNAKLDTTNKELVVLRDTTVIRSPGFDYLAELQPELLVRGNAGSGEKLLVTIKDEAGNTVKTFDSSLSQMTQLSTGNWTITAANWGATVLAAGKYTAFSQIIVTDGSGGQTMEAPIEFTVVAPTTRLLASNAGNNVDDSNSKVYALADGSGYWVFWAQQATNATTINDSSNYYNLMAEKYNMLGQKVGSTITLSDKSGQQNTLSSNHVTMFDVYMKQDGSFTVFYSQDFITPYLQHYNANGTANGARITLSNTLQYEIAPCYVSLDDGRQILLYASGTVSDYNIYAQRYDANSVAIDATAKAITTGTNAGNGYCYNATGTYGTPSGNSMSPGHASEGMSAVAVGDNKYAVLYQSMVSPTGVANGNDKTNMLLKIYDANIATSTNSVAAITANTEVAGLQIGAKLVRLHDGSFVAVWASNHTSALTTGSTGTMDGFDVYSRRFTWDASKQQLVALDAKEGRVNTSTDGVNGVVYNDIYANLSATALVQGGYVVTWAKYTSTTKSEIYTQTYDAAGNKVGGETLISVASPNLDFSPSVSALPDGGYIVTWSTYASSTSTFWDSGTSLNGDVKTMVINSDGTVRGSSDTTNYPKATVTIAAADNEVMIGSAGVDTLDGRSHTGLTLNGLAGNDYLMIDNLNFASIDGGVGFDTLLWSSTGDLNLAATSNKVNGIEAIHLGDSNANKLTLTLESVQNASATTDVLVVYGGTNDSVVLTDAGWTLIGQQAWRGGVYNVYENSNSTDTSLWLDSDITVNNTGATSTASIMNLSSGLLRGSAENDAINVTAEQNTIDMGNGGQDILTFSILDDADNLGGHSETIINGFTVGTYGTTSDADRIDISGLLRSDEEFNRLAEEYSNGNVDLSALTDYLTVVNEGSNTSIMIDRDGGADNHELTTLVTLTGVQTDLESLLLNNQLVI